MGRAHVERITHELAGAQVVAVADINLDAARAVADPLGARAYSDGRELIDDPGVDAIIVATFGSVHGESVIPAVRAGKYVLCEKPLATTAAACLEIMDAEQRAGRKLVTVGFMRRFDPAYREMKSVLEAGEHGYATLVHNRHRNPSVPEHYTSRMAIDDTAIHEIDTMRWLLGEEIVSARVDRPRFTSHRYDHLQDPIVVVMYTESGVRIDDEVNVNLQFAYSIECELVLETGTVSLGDQERVHIRDLSGHRNAMCRSHIDRFHDAFNVEVQEWIRAVSAGEHTGADSWDGYAAACVVDAAVASLDDPTGPLVPVTMIARPALYQ